MAFPPTIPPNDRANTTPQLDAHADDHNTIADALAGLVDHMKQNYVQSGLVNVALVNGQADTTVTFPIAFAAVPSVVAVVAENTGLSRNYHVVVAGLATTQFIVRVSATEAGSANIDPFRIAYMAQGRIL